MLSQRNMWDRLRSVVVGRSWPPEFYAWIQDPAVRAHMEKIAVETEEDLAGLARCYESLGVSVLRPELQITPDDPDLPEHIRTTRPPMVPGDDLIMLGTTLVTSFIPNGQDPAHFANVIKHVQQQGNPVISTDLDSLCGAGVYQFTDEIFYTIGKQSERHCADRMQQLIQDISGVDQVHRMHQIGHIDAWFTPVTPGLIVAWDDPERPHLLDMFFQRYFAGWEVVRLRPTLIDVHLFQRWREQHTGRWWLPGQEDNRALIDFINGYFATWLGDVSETAFDLNMSIVDHKNCIVSHYNQQVFDAFQRHGVTPHVTPLRYANFWDGAVHCVTTELHRQG